ncbi:MAG: hypothetical protein ACFFAN_12520 [Promethearchaeota archaeon]
MEISKKRISYKESWNHYGKWLGRTLKKRKIDIAGATAGIDPRDEMFLCHRPP